MTSTTGQKSKRAPGGFTLLELMIVVVVLGALTAMAWPVFRGTYRNLTAELARDGVMSALAYARERAVMRSQPHRIAIDPLGTSYSLEARGEDGFEPVKDGLGVPRRLPEGFEIESNLPSVVFTPEGTAGAATLRLIFQGASLCIIKIDPLLGKARIAHEDS